MSNQSTNMEFYDNLKQAALNNVMHHDTQQLPSEMSPDIEMMEVVQGVPVITFSSPADVATKNQTLESSQDNSVQPGTSNIMNSKPKMLTFNVKYLDHTYKIDMADSSTLSMFIFSSNMLTN